MSFFQTQAGSWDITPAAADGSISLDRISGRAAAVAKPPEQCHKPAEARRNETSNYHHFIGAKLVTLK